MATITTHSGPQHPQSQDVILPITSRRVHPLTTMAADADCQTGDDSPICRIFRKEGRCDSAEAILIEGRICLAQA